MSDNPRVLRMNTLSSTRYDDVPYPAKQQLGEQIDRVDVDARSGNGVADKLKKVDDQASDYQKLDSTRGGHEVHEVTYHLESTPPPSEPAGAPGSDAYNISQGREPERGTHTVNRTQGNATLAMQREEEYINTQREVPGRNERYAAAVGGDDHASAEAGSGHAATVVPSQTDEDSGGENGRRKNSGDNRNSDNVPQGSMQAVLSWVGDDDERRQKALEAERKRDNPRSTLISRLEGDDDK